MRGHEGLDETGDPKPDDITATELPLLFGAVSLGFQVCFSGFLRLFLAFRSVFGFWEGRAEAF